MLSKTLLKCVLIHTSTKYRERHSSGTVLCLPPLNQSITRLLPDKLLLIHITIRPCRLYSLPANLLPRSLRDALHASCLEHGIWVPRRPVHLIDHEYPTGVALHVPPVLAIDGVDLALREGLGEEWGMEEGCEASEASGEVGRADGEPVLGHDCAGRRILRAAMGRDVLFSASSDEHERLW